MLIILCLSLNIYNLFGLIKKWDFKSVSRDYVSSWDNHLQLLKQKLPPDTQYVGYVADENLQGIRSPTTHELFDFDLTEYALIPIIVRRGLNYPWIIGNFSSKNFEGWLRNSIGTYDIEDMGSGIYIIHRVQR